MRKKIFKLIQESKSILVLTHKSPDGDAIGSSLAMYHYLKSINKDVDMVILDIPRVFQFLPSIDKAVENTSRTYDLGIVLDCPSREMLGQKEELFKRCKTTVVIDHHVSNTGYGDVNYVHGTVSSCCQVVYYLFKEEKVGITKEMGEAIIAGAITDTIGFSTNSVDSDTFKMAADIMDLGVMIHSIYNRVMHTKSMPRYNLMKIAMERLEFLCDGKIAFTYVLEDDFQKTGAVYGEHEGIVDIGRNIEGVLVSAFIRESGGWLISLRSTGKIDVQKIAHAFGGGGHVMASGATMQGSLEETKKKLIDEIKKAIFE